MCEEQEQHCAVILRTYCTLHSGLSGKGTVPYRTVGKYDRDLVPLLRLAGSMLEKMDKAWVNEPLGQNPQSN